MPNCSVRICKNRNENVSYQRDGITFHRFPKNGKYKEKWITATRMPDNWFPTTNSTICSQHFEGTCFRPSDQRRLLFSNAIPTLKLKARLVYETVSKPDEDDSPVCDDETRARGIGGGDGGGGEGAGGSGGSGKEDACATCGGLVGMLGWHARGSPAEQYIRAAIFPREVNERTLLCIHCHKRYCDKGKQKDKTNPRKSSHSKESTSTSAAQRSTISLPSYKRACSRFESCLFPRCPKKENLHVIPLYMKKCLLRDYKLYTPEDTLLCREHLFSKNWKPILKIAESDFTAEEIEDVISTLTVDLNALNFDNIENIPPNLLLYCTGINHFQLQSILDKTPSLMRKTKTPVLALTAYLTKLRTNDSFYRLSTLFQITTPILEQMATVAGDCMLKEFVPAAPSSWSVDLASGALTAVNPVLSYLQEHYYGQGATTKASAAIRSSLEPASSYKVSQHRKRKSSSDTDDSSFALKVKAKKRLIKKEVGAKESLEGERGQYTVSEVGVEFESPEGAEDRDASKCSEDKEDSLQPRVKEEPVDEGEVEQEEYATDQEDPPADPLSTVPPPILEIKREEDLVTIKLEPGEDDRQTQSTAETLQPPGDSVCTVYYTKGTAHFVQGSAPNL